MKPIYILGISAFFHDSAAAILKDGEIIAAAQEERFTRRKHDPSFPVHAIEYCLEEAGIKPEDLDYVSYYEKPLLKFDRLISSYLHDCPKGFSSFFRAVPQWLNKKFFVEREIDESLDNKFEGPIHYCTHHQSHAASAYYPSPFASSAVITFDGVGEWSTTTWGVGKENIVQIHSEVRFPHSLGLLYSAFTYFTGFKVNSGEYKLMGLAPYGNPKYFETIKEEIIDIKQDGSFKLNMDYFNYISGLKMTSQKFADLFDRPPRDPESPITEDDMDLAASVQKVTEEVMLKIARHVRKETGEKNLCLAGGVALNCVGNGLIVGEKIFDNVWIQPAAGDAGGALGAALYSWHQVLDKKRSPDGINDSQKGSLLGPSYSNEDIIKKLTQFSATFESLEDDPLFERVAKEIEAGKVIGFFQGRMEYGPRALGSRSILGKAQSPEIQKQMNLKIKYRESFRPFAPSCLEEDLQDFFDLDTPSPYMLLTAPVHADRLRTLSEEDKSKTGLEKLDVTRSNLPAITHVDNSARVQSVSEVRHPRLYKLLKTLKNSGSEGILVNTSFNIRGEPIVMTPEDAYRCFMCTEMDILVLENQVCLKEDQPECPGAKEYKKQFKLD